MFLVLFAHQVVRWRPQGTGQGEQAGPSPQVGWVEPSRVGGEGDMGAVRVGQMLMLQEREGEAINY